MVNKKRRSIILIIAGVILITISGNALYYGIKFLKPVINQSDYSWDTDPQRFTFPESISNVTLMIYYGVGNSNINETIENITLTDHYTTVFDILNSCCTVVFKTHWWNHPTFFITGINGILENEATDHFWLYEINGSYVPAGANAISPGNNSIVRWFYE